jgi:hypothetical protein
MIRLYCIQTKQLQEMQIFLTGDQTISSFNASNNSPPPPAISMSHNFSSSMALNNTLNNSKNASMISNSGGIGSTSIQPGTSILHQIFPNNVNNASSTQSLNHHKLNTSGENRTSSDTDQIKSASRPPGFNAEDSAIIHVNTQIGGPILMTPDAFVNSPNNQNIRKSLNSSDIKPPGIDLIQSLMSNAGLSTNLSQSLNLTSSRASSLTQVTANSNNIPATLPVVSNSNSMNNSTKLSSSNGNGANNNNNKRLGKKIRNRAAVAASSTSSTSSSSTTSSSDSDLDPADKEIASLSAKGDRAKKLYNDKQSEFMLLNNVRFNTIYNFVTKIIYQWLFYFNLYFRLASTTRTIITIILKRMKAKSTVVTITFLI